MTLEAPDRTSVMTATRRATRDLTSLLRSVRDPHRTAIGYWSIGEVATHVSHIYGMYPAIARGEGSPVADHIKLAEYWDRRLAEDRERDPAVAADRIDAAVDEFSEVVGGAAWEDLVSWHGALRVPVWCLPTILINESDVHGLDIATAESTRWEISASDARAVIHGLMPLLGGYVNAEATRGVHAALALHVRGGPTFYVVVDDGTCTTDSVAPNRVDCHVSTAPVDYVLIAYGRRSQLASALKGKVVAWGRKPWLSLRFPAKFHRP